MMTYEEFMANLHEYNRLKDELKRRAMIFQADDKERAAKHFGKPFDAFYDLPYTEWAKVRSQYFSEI
jgi:hypothetical protein